MILIYVQEIKIVKPLRILDFFLQKCLIKNVDTLKVSKGAKIRIRYNQLPHLTQDTNGKVTNSVIHHKREPRRQPVTSR